MYRWSVLDGGTRNLQTYACTPYTFELDYASIILLFIFDQFAKKKEKIHPFYIFVIKDILFL